MNKMQGIVDGKEWFNSLPSSTKKRIKMLKRFSKEEWREWHLKMNAQEKIRNVIS